MKHYHAALFPPKPPPRPSGKAGSWWLGLDRDQLHDRMKLEQARMSGSKFANISTFAGYEDRRIAARAVGKSR